MNSILIKLTGTIFNPSQNGEGFFIEKIINQIKELKKNYNIGIVIGGGNIFRGNQHGKQFNLSKTTGHNAGMLATMINGLILQDLFEKQDLDSIILSAIECPKITNIINQQNIKNALKDNKIIIFVSGTGNPFFTTDTNAILRALQINAQQVFKCTNVDGVYSDDPAKKESVFYKNISYKEYIEKNLKIMDLTAITLAQENSIKIRVFNIFKDNALINAIKDPSYGSNIF
ncbi:UMP kinase [Candidatus Babeliales bacterium]|nr:UMP kinase [Candidatus Babeliales bacterium]MCF7899252.1 UMP kinase [Candidatus Babeliales bacterium]